MSVDLIHPITSLCLTRQIPTDCRCLGSGRQAQRGLTAVLTRGVRPAASPDVRNQTPVRPVDGDGLVMFA